MSSTKTIYILSVGGAYEYEASDAFYSLEDLHKWLVENWDADPQELIDDPYEVYRDLEILVQTCELHDSRVEKIEKFLGE